MVTYLARSRATPDTSISGHVSRSRRGGWGLRDLEPLRCREPRDDGEGEQRAHVPHVDQPHPALHRARLPLLLHHSLPQRRRAPLGCPPSGGPAAARAQLACQALWFWRLLRPKTGLAASAPPPTPPRPAPSAPYRSHSPRPLCGAKPRAARARAQQRP
jgi:hypothetical protein